MNELEIDLGKTGHDMGPMGAMRSEAPMYPHLTLDVPEGAEVEWPKKGYVRFEYELDSKTDRVGKGKTVSLNLVELCEVSPTDDEEEAAEDEDEVDVDEKAEDAIDRMAKEKSASKVEEE